MIGLGAGVRPGEMSQRHIIMTALLFRNSTGKTVLTSSLRRHFPHLSRSDCSRAATANRWSVKPTFERYCTRGIQSSHVGRVMWLVHHKIRLSPGWVVWRVGYLLPPGRAED